MRCDREEQQTPIGCRADFVLADDCGNAARVVGDGRYRRFAARDGLTYLFAAVVVVVVNPMLSGVAGRRSPSGGGC